MLLLQAESLCDLLNATIAEHDKKKPLRVHRLFRPVTNNVMWRFTSGRRTHYTDPEVQHLNRCTNSFFRIMESDGILTYLLLNYAWFGSLCKVGVSVLVKIATEAAEVDHL